jgi:hypothetical protein
VLAKIRSHSFNLIIPSLYGNDDRSTASQIEALEHIEIKALAIDVEIGNLVEWSLRQDIV